MWALPLVAASIVDGSPDIVYAMHEAWCALAGREQQNPCMKHRLMQDGEQQNPQLGAMMESIDRQTGLEIAEAHNKEMHEWWCTRKEATEASAGSPLREFCDGWAELKLKEQAYSMHEAWCALAGHEQQGPCMKHRAMQELDDPSRPHLRGQLSETMSQIDLQVPLEVGEMQYRRMHDWWCGRQETTEAAADSPLRVFCDGWVEHRLKEEL